MTKIGTTLIALQGQASIVDRCKIDCGDGKHQIQIWNLNDKSSIVIHAEYVKCYGKLKTIFKDVNKSFLLYSSLKRKYKKQVAKAKQDQGRTICI